MNLLVQLLKRHHLSLWVGTWTTVMVMAWGAIAILLNPNLSQRLASEPQRYQPPRANVTTQQRLRSQEHTRPSSSSGDPVLVFWTFGAVAIACGCGSIILSQHIKPSKRR